MSFPKQFQPVNRVNLRRLRMEQGLSQDELAKRAGYSDRLIRKAEAGGNVCSQTIRDLADALSFPDAPVTYEDLVLDHLAMAKQFVHGYDHYGQWMLDTCLDLFHKSFVFYCPGDPNQVPFAGEWVGVAGMQTFFDRFFSLFTREPGTLQPTYLVGESHVCARYYDQVFFQGHTLPTFWVNLHIQFKDGLISRIDDEYDTKATAAALDELLARLKDTPAAS